MDNGQQHRLAHIRTDWWNCAGLIRRTNGYKIDFIRFYFDLLATNNHENKSIFGWFYCWYTRLKWVLNVVSPDLSIVKCRLQKFISNPVSDKHWNKENYASTCLFKFLNLLIYVTNTFQGYHRPLHRYFV